MVTSTSEAMRQTRSIFLDYSPFRVIAATRSILDNLLIIVPMAVLGLWFELRFNEVPEPVLAKPGIRTIVYLSDHQYHRHLPLLVAVCLYLAIRWWTPLIGLGVVVVSVALLLALPGLAAGRAVPALAFVAAALWLRQPRGRRLLRGLVLPQATLRQPTLAGFRPSVRSWGTRRGRAALRACQFADPRVPGWTVNIDIRLFDQATRAFRAARNSRSEAYVAARAIDYLLRNSRFAEAEERARAIETSDTLRDEPAALAARALFLRSVGLHEDAVDDLRKAMNAAGRRAPAELLGLIAEVLIDIPGLSLRQEWRLTDRRRAALVWRRQQAAVMLALAAEAADVASTHADVALRRAYQVMALTYHPSDGSTDVTETFRVLQARAVALSVAASVYARKDEHYDAARCYMDAYELLKQCKDRTRAGRCLILASAHAIRAGYCDADVEDRVIDLIRVGLQVIEEDRGILRGQHHRAAWIAAQQHINSTVLHVVIGGIRHHRAKAAELALWLLESLHRTALSAMISSPLLDTDPALRAALLELTAREAAVHVTDIGRLREQASVRPDLVRLRNAVIDRFGSVQEVAMMTDTVDLEDALRRLGDRVALLYHCWEEPGGWVIHSVLAARSSGVWVHRSELRNPSAGAEPSPLLHPVGILNAIRNGDPQTVEFLFRGIPLSADVWRQIAEAILPPQLSDVLRRSVAAGQTPELLVVPDGPIGGLPLPGLPLTDGRLLIDCATTVFTPALTVLRTPTIDQPPVTVNRVVGHFDSDGVVASDVERAAWREQSSVVSLRDTHTRDELLQALLERPRPDVVVISTHGDTSGKVSNSVVRLRDGSIISGPSALGIRWPRTVLLGACWISVTSSTAGRDPVGFPIACLMRGAETVIGGIAPIEAEESARILAGVATALPNAPSAVQALRSATIRQLDSTPELRGRPPSSWACIAGWTVEPSLTNGAEVAPFALRWERDGTPRPDNTTSFGDATDDEHSIEYFAAPRSKTTYSSKHDAIVAGGDPFGWNAITRAAMVKLLLGVGIGVAVVFFLVNQIVQGLADTVLPEPGYIGVELAPGAGGPVVVGVRPDGPATTVLRVGDVIVSVAGTQATTPGDAVLAVRARRPGETVELIVKRGETVITVSVTLAATPSQGPQ